MRSGDTRTKIGRWKPRLMRAAFWALLGLLSMLFAWAIEPGLGSLGLSAQWNVGQILVDPSILIVGLIYTSALGIAVWWVRIGNWRQIAGFSFLAMPWLLVAFNVGFAAYKMLPAQQSSNAFLYNPDPIEMSLLVFVGLIAGGIWVTLSGLLLFPVLRASRSVGVLFTASVVASVIASVLPELPGLPKDSNFFVGWAATYAAAFSLALPQERPQHSEVASDQA